jgi:hypothetical protein
LTRARDGTADGARRLGDDAAQSLAEAGYDPTEDRARL